MSKVDQLLAKALSTTSEDEAIACLRMARKQPGVEKISTKNDTNIDWYSKAEQYYKLSKELQNRLNMTKASYDFMYKQLNDYVSMYSRANDVHRKLRIEMCDLKSWYKKRDSIMGSILAAAIIVALVVLL